MTFGRRQAAAPDPPESQKTGAAKSPAWCPFAVAILVVLVGAILMVRAMDRPGRQDEPKGAPAAVATPAPAGVGEAALAVFPNTRIDYYDVTGADARAVSAALHEKGPIDPNDHVRAHALTTWRISWRWPARADGDCDLKAATVRFEARVLLPRLIYAEPRSPQLEAAWNRYMGALRLHEAGHLQRAYDRMDDVLAAVKGASCSDANTAAMRVLNEIRQGDIDYDAATGHGRTQGAVFPSGLNRRDGRRAP